MEKKNRAGTLFYAENQSLRFLAIPFLALFLVFTTIEVVKARQGLISLLDSLAVNAIVAAACFVGWFAGRQRLFLFSNHLCSTLGAFKQRVFYANIRSISLADYLGKQLLLSFELKKPRYSPVQDVSIPRANCQEILQILAREAPQAEMNELAVKWRDALESETPGHQPVTA